MESPRVLVLGLFACAAVHGQSQDAPPAFEVASIKTSAPEQAVSFKRSGYHIAATGTSLEWLITWAFDIHTDRVYNKPKWLGSARYDVVANGPEDRPLPPVRPGEPGPLMVMMQKLLAERFKLAVHDEKRDLPMYALVIAPGGAKVKPRPEPEVYGQNPFRFEGAGRMGGTEVSASMLAKVLSNQLGRSVQDETGIRGAFDFKLEWAPEGEIALAQTRPSIFTAIQEQLGLKLEARKGPVRVIVIDHVEPLPTEN